MNLPEKTEVGVNSISYDEISASSDPDSDINKSNVLKQVPEKVLVKGDAANLKHFSQLQKLSLDFWH